VPITAALLGQLASTTSPPPPAAAGGNSNTPPPRSNQPPSTSGGNSGTSPPTANQPQSQSLPPPGTSQVIDAGGGGGSGGTNSQGADVSSSGGSGGSSNNKAAGAAAGAVVGVLGAIGLAVGAWYLHKRGAARQAAYGKKVPDGRKVPLTFNQMFEPEAGRGGTSGGGHHQDGDHDDGGAGVAGVSTGAAYEASLATEGFRGRGAAAGHSSRANTARGLQAEHSGYGGGPAATRDGSGGYGGNAGRTEGGMQQYRNPLNESIRSEASSAMSGRPLVRTRMPSDMPSSSSQKDSGLTGHGKGGRPPSQAAEARLESDNPAWQQQGAIHWGWDNQASGPAPPKGPREQRGGSRARPSHSGFENPLWDAHRQ
jgi:hypothetical protein